MKLSELMAGKTPSTVYEGFATNDDFVLAIDTAGTATAVGEYAAVQVGVTHHEASINSDTSDSRYIRTGKITTKTGAQRTFSVEGERYIGDDFQDWALSRTTMFGTGNAVIRKYVYFNVLTGEGEQGSLTIVVNDTQSGDAGEHSGFSIDMTSTETPTEYTYTAV